MAVSAVSALTICRRATDIAIRPLARDAKSIVPNSLRGITRIVIATDKLSKDLATPLIPLCPVSEKRPLTAAKILSATAISPIAIPIAIRPCFNSPRFILLRSFIGRIRRFRPKANASKEPATPIIFEALIAFKPAVIPPVTIIKMDTAMPPCFSCSIGILPSFATADASKYIDPEIRIIFCAMERTLFTLLVISSSDVPTAASIGFLRTNFMNIPIATTISPNKTNMAVIAGNVFSQLSPSHFFNAMDNKSTAPEITKRALATISNCSPSASPSNEFVLLTSLLAMPKIAPTSTSKAVTTPKLPRTRVLSTLEMIHNEAAKIATDFAILRSISA